MNKLRQQKGATAIGWIFLLVLLIVIAIPLTAALPIYINSLQVNRALKGIEGRLSVQPEHRTPDGIKNLLLNILESKMPKEIKADEITVSKVDNVYRVRVAHQFKSQIKGNWYIVLEVDDAVDIPSAK